MFFTDNVAIQGLSGSGIYSENLADKLYLKGNLRWGIYDPDKQKNDFTMFFGGKHLNDVLLKLIVKDYETTSEPKD